MKKVVQDLTSGGLLGVWGKWVKHTKYIYNIQDFNPEQVLAVGYTKSKFITDAMMWFDKFSCKRSDLVITVGRDLVETVENRFKGKKVPKTVMINNWIDENEIYPLDESNERVVAFKKKYGLDGCKPSAFCFHQTVRAIHPPVPSDYRRCARPCSAG